jgi:hypothetical protein
MLKTVSAITNAIGALNFKGTWDANANSPALTSSVGTKGDYYVVGTAGTTNLNGISNWGVGDWATFNGSVWQRVEGGADLNGVNLSVSGTSTLSGLTLVGTATSLVGTSHSFLSPAANGSSYAGAFQQNAVGPDGRVQSWALPNTNDGGAYFIYAANSGGNCFNIFGNGNVTNTNNSYGAISDAKLKENVTDATPKLEKLNQVRIVNFNMIGQEQKQLGVIAQELEQIFPGLVQETPDRDAEGNYLGTTTKSVKYSVFVPMLIKAIQEQQAQIETIKAEIAALKGV